MHCIQWSLDEMREIRNLWENREKTMIGRESTIQTDRATERLFRVSNERKRGNQKGEKDKQRNGVIQKWRQTGVVMK